MQILQNACIFMPLARFFGENRVNKGIFLISRTGIKTNHIVYCPQASGNSASFALKSK
jgi:hypothetical protein